MNSDHQLLETQVAAEDVVRLLEQAVGLAQKAALQTSAQTRSTHPELRALSLHLVSLSVKLDCEKGKLLLALGMPANTQLQPKETARSR